MMPLFANLLIVSSHTKLRQPQFLCLQLCRPLYESMQEDKDSPSVSKVKNPDLVFCVLSSQLPDPSSHL